MNSGLDFDFILEKPATRPRDRCGKEQLRCSEDTNRYLLQL
jgi:hypothetical protein